MSNLGKNRAGFGTLETLLLFIIVSAISLTVWYVWHVKMQADLNLKVTGSSNSQEAKHTTDQSSKQQTITTQPSPTQTQPAAGTGITGQTLRGLATGCYSQDPNSSCGKSPSVQASIDIQNKNPAIDVNEKSIVTIASDTSGLFSVNLLPGTYYLVPKPLSNGEKASPQTVNVTDGQYINVAFVYN